MSEFSPNRVKSVFAIVVKTYECPRCGVKAGEPCKVEEVELCPERLELLIKAVLDKLGRD